MKKTIRTIVAALLLFVAANGNAADGLDLKINDQQNLVVELQGVESKAVLSLRDESGVVIFKDQFLNQDNYSKTLSFEDLPNGTYTLTLDKEFTVSNSRIHKSGKSLIVDNGKYEFVFKPMFKTYGKKVLVYMANPAEKNTEIEIFDLSGEQVGNLKTKDLVLKKTFDFTEVPSGEYTLKVTSGDHVFYKTLQVG